MPTLHDSFMRELQKQFEFSDFTAEIIEKELEPLKIQLSRKQRAQLAAGLRARQQANTLDRPLGIQIDDNGILRVTESPDGSAGTIDVLPAAAKKVKRILAGMPAIIDKSASAGSAALIARIHKESSRRLQAHRGSTGRFMRRLYAMWRAPLDLLEILITISTEIGAECNASVRSQANNGVSPRFEVLSRAHARACQVALEILTLLQHGFADGAHARWRTVHEIAVEVALVRDGDDELARRYLQHVVVQEFKSAQLYQKHCSEIHYEPIPGEEMQKFTEAYNTVVIRYGQEFANDNGWAAQVVGKPSPTFRDLEAAANIDHIRPFYKLASLNVHAGPRGIMHRLGLTEKQQGTLLLAGPSVYGLAEPIQNTAYSLNLITASLLTFGTNLDYLVAMRTLVQLGEEIFGAVDKTRAKTESHINET